LISWTSGPSLTKGVLPYKQMNGNFQNPNSYQIISPGKDGVFGAGGLPWDATIADQMPKNLTQLGDGRDDLSNFNYSVLGKQ
jgi:hypothetical protein